MLPIRIDVKVTENLPSGPKLRLALALGLRDGLERIRRRAEQQFAAEAPSSREGSGLRVETHQTPQGIQARLGTPRFEARLLETGSKKSQWVIRPRRARRRRGTQRVATLTSTGRERARGERRYLSVGIGGGVIFRRQVTHKKLRPTFWLSRSVDAGIPDAREAVAERLRDTFRG